MPRVALVQFASVNPWESGAATSSAADDNDDDDVQDSGHAPSSFNLQRAHDFVRQAAKQGAELVVFPEYFARPSISPASLLN